MTKPENVEHSLDPELESKELEGEAVERRQRRGDTEDGHGVG